MSNLLNSFFTLLEAEDKFSLKNINKEAKKAYNPKVPKWLKTRMTSRRKSLAPIGKSQLRFIKTVSIPMPMPVRVAKSSRQGIWKISPMDAVNIARKYRFYLPNPKKPMKHLSTSGIVLFRNDRGQYFLIKSNAFKRKPRRKTALFQKLAPQQPKYF